MKFKQFTKTVAVGSFGSAFCFLASCKDADKEASNTTDKPVVETPATPAAEAPTMPVTPADATPAEADIESVPVFIVTVSGSG